MILQLLIYYNLYLVHGYRLLYLPYLENNYGSSLITRDQQEDKISLISRKTTLQRLYVLNQESNLVLSLPSLENISKMYVVVHDRSVYFYNNGVYYSFGLSDDGVQIILEQVSIFGNTQFYNQDLKQVRMGFRNWGKIVDKNVNEKVVDKKPEVVRLVKKTNEIFPSNTHRGVVKHLQNENIDKISPDGLYKNPINELHQKNINNLPDYKNKINELYQKNINNLPENVKIKKPVLERSKTIINDVVNNKDKIMNLEIVKNNTEEDDVNEIKQMLYPYKKLDIENKIVDNKKKMPILSTRKSITFNSKNDKLKNYSETFIESDSTINPYTNLDFKIKESNKFDRSFFLKTSDNLCMTYFEEKFILTKCTESNYQHFKMEEATNVVNKLPHKIFNNNQSNLVNNRKILCKDGICTSVNKGNYNNRNIHYPKLSVNKKLKKNIDLNDESNLFEEIEKPSESLMFYSSAKKTPHDLKINKKVVSVSSDESSSNINDSHDEYVFNKKLTDQNINSKLDYVNTLDKPPVQRTKNLLDRIEIALS